MLLWARFHTGWIAPEATTSACVLKLAAERARSACAATVCTASAVACSQLMMCGTPPAFAMASWLATLESELSEQIEAIAPRPRTARSESFVLSSPTRRFETMTRLSACLAAREASAPIELCADLAVSPVTSSPTSGSMAPNLAIVDLLGALSWASAQSADAD